MRSVPLSWKIAAIVLGLIAGSFAWHGVDQYLAQRKADQIMQNLAQTEAQNAQLAKEHAEQYRAKVAATLNRQQQDLYLINQQVAEQARQFKAEQAVRLRRQQEAAALQQERYKLGSDQKCVGGQVINARGSSFTQATGKNGKPIPCSGQVASEPLR